MEILFSAEKLTPKDFNKWIWECPLELFKRKVLSLTETWIPTWNNAGNRKKKTEPREESLESKTNPKPKCKQKFKVQLTQPQYSHEKPDTHPYFDIKSISSTGTPKALPPSSPSALIPLFWRLTPVPVLDLTPEQPPYTL